MPRYTLPVYVFQNSKGLLQNQGRLSIVASRKHRVPPLSTCNIFSRQGNTEHGPVLEMGMRVCLTLKF